MIDKQIYGKYNLPDISDYPHSERDWYETFLIQTDYITAKLSEKIALGKTITEDITAILEAREFAREQINLIDDGNYTGTKSMTHVPVYSEGDIEYVDFTKGGVE